ncbi:hypothetical protein WKR88_20390 [Trinickia caryophylli]|uniref:Lipoprotein n=1 Tax=Trinickia caryophylli TaxID=28094 RepID=A0A1X7G8R1_TRICW|nr:hypothetical protein [Trinickia caryophylli]PMS11414.1 hypothetical protein C0Z17_14845 [Trinickia caryophylli]TRX17609.1 hypothetical protein FNF07_04760 [Trinickia caryophylli]WQE11638.1 hypothetical protein U0034_18140 [Trinickia caryophylli]SMF65931.1 hypothetical protein SAMN06295900_11469 [Trinickia caryophylli]GLU34818.1 hypothetical protein Busp01_46600 [Trinickia caryophylli]
MKTTRTLSLVGALLASTSFAGCALYENPSACEAQMRTQLTQHEPQRTLSVSHVAVGIGGARIVVEGALAARASAAGAASAPATSLAKAKPAPKQPTAFECTFDGRTLATTHWLAPADMAATAGDDDARDIVGD